MGTQKLDAQRCTWRWNQVGNVNWSAAAALTAAVAALAAVVTTAGIFREMQQEAQHAQFNAGLESLWHLSAQWDSAYMADARSNAAAGLLAGRPTADVDAVLDFFEELALLLNRGVLDEEMVCHEFYVPLATYWVASQDYIRTAQGDDSTAWTDLRSAVSRLTAIEARRKHRTATEVLPSAAQQREFLMSEQADAECDEGEDVRKTPL